MSPAAAPASVLGRIAVLGAGSWGTTYAKVLADAGREVVLWARRDSVAADISATRSNSGYLPGVVLPDNLRATSDIDEALAGVDAVALGVPSQSMRENLTVFRDAIPASVPVISLAKGVEIGTGYFRPYTITDVIGAEIAGTGKNIIALACGIAGGLDLGLNTSASLMTRGLNEVSRLGQALGGQAATFAGLAGLGDLVATCSSPLSRNRTLGGRLAGGMGLETAVAAAGGQVAEGVVSCRSVRDLAHRHQIDMPITEAVYLVCYLHMAPVDMIRSLMDRPHTSE